MSQPTENFAASHFDEMAQRYEEVTGGCTKALARHILSLPAVAAVTPALAGSDARVLDNACGTGFVTELILQSGSGAQLHAVDAAPGMVDLARAKVRGSHADTAVMPGEALAFPDEHFSHSFTNLGILFFKSAADGAREIYRTLLPGGVAIVTSWSRLGTVEDAIAPAQQAVRPGDTPFRMPIDPRWFDEKHLEKTMREDGGFADVEMATHRVFWGAPTRKALHGLLYESFRELVLEGWSEEECGKFSAALEGNVERSALEFVMNDGKAGFGMAMDGIIAICRK